MKQKKFPLYLCAYFFIYKVENKLLNKMKIFGEKLLIEFYEKTTIKKTNKWEITRSRNATAVKLKSMILKSFYYYFF